MYKPWTPIQHELSTHPCIDLSIIGRSLVVNWKEFKNNSVSLEMDIFFENGIAGIFCLDESTYMSSAIEELPIEEDLKAGDFENLPWPAWISECNYRKHVYGSLGELSYENVFTYWFVGDELVFLIDVADSEPQIKIKQ